MSRVFVALFFLALVCDAVAADMPLTDLEGKVSNLNGYQGNWVVVNYWATWCPPCIEEIPELQSFHDSHVDKGAMVIGINVELIGKRQLESFLDSFFIQYPVFHTRPDLPSALGEIPGLPTTFLVSPNGKVVARQVGPVTQKMIEKFIANQVPL
jgi:thiol-disulfide isomerase/thioredoxin